MDIKLIVFDLNLTLCHRKTKTVREHTETLLQYCKIYTDAKIVLWTAAMRKNIMNLLNTTMLTKYFDTIITRDDVSVKDPDSKKPWDVIKPEGYLATTFDVAAENILFVEDSPLKLRFNTKCKQYIVKEMTPKVQDDELLDLLVWIIKNSDKSN